MAVKRIVANISAPDTDKACAFYTAIFDLELVMDHGWIKTLSAGNSMTTQISLASQGGADTEVPDLSIEVDDLDAVLSRVKAAGIALEYGPTFEPWGVRRFYIRDPQGTLINVLQHN
ncbi:VOC family protein [Bowmanella yangjiangensis]|uniref:VOC family protein n=1 Tax=Bowmanella yangjiangensis TaxID=2811230 RepID=A0ABS3D003_9ALTE|nr:VOC family protein [Bowmanella yangjiangensis]MBN7822134.1 VOC family protein [Bowmanella yangjiangensis]